MLFKILTSNIAHADAPYHPPPEELSSPYSEANLKDLPSDLGYEIKLVHGVFHVYSDKSAVAR